MEQNEDEASLNIGSERIVIERIIWNPFKGGLDGD